ncbi:MAG: hypothetical protein ACM3KR_06520 [Deltaproteobacteria bacterium]
MGKNKVGQKKHKMNERQMSNKRPELALALQNMFRLLENNYSAKCSYKNGNIYIQGILEEKHKEAAAFIKESLKKKGIRIDTITEIPQNREYNLIIQLKS